LLIGTTYTESPSCLYFPGHSTHFLYVTAPYIRFSRAFSSLFYIFSLISIDFNVIEVFSILHQDSVYNVPDITLGYRFSIKFLPWRKFNQLPSLFFQNFLNQISAEAECARNQIKKYNFVATYIILICWKIHIKRKIDGYVTCYKNNATLKKLWKNRMSVNSLHKNVATRLIRV
jgi:hypothetical protein